MLFVLRYDGKETRAMLDALQNPIVIAVVVLVLLALIAIPVLIRRRAARNDVQPPPELGPAVDYTSVPYVEPQTFGERLRAAPIGVKLLLVLVPVALIVAGFVVWQAFFNTPSEVVIPPPPPAAITDVTATLASAARIVVDAKTNLPDGTEVTANMQEGDADFPWFNPQSNRAQVSGGQIRIVIERAATAPQPRRGQDHTVVLSASANNQSVTSDAAKLSIPAIYTNDFYRDKVAVAPTVAPTPTKAPAAPTAVAATATPVPEPSAAPAPKLSAKVFNGGNVRDQPVSGKVLDQINANETVTLIEKTADGTWYKITNERQVTGWVSVTLLTIDDATIAQVPITGAGAPTPAAGPATGLTAKVFNGGNVRERPISGQVLDQINANETVTLIEKTADGTWYHITNERQVSGWVSVTLLTIDDATKAKVPVAK